MFGSTTRSELPALVHRMGARAFSSLATSSTSALASTLARRLGLPILELAPHDTVSKLTGRTVTQPFAIAPIFRHIHAQMLASRDTHRSVFLPGPGAYIYQVEGDATLRTISPSVIACLAFAKQMADRHRTTMDLTIADRNTDVLKAASNRQIVFPLKRQSPFAIPEPISAWQHQNTQYFFNALYLSAYASKSPQLPIDTFGGLVEDGQIVPYPDEVLPADSQLFVTDGAFLESTASTDMLELDLRTLRFEPGELDIAIMTYLFDSITNELETTEAYQDHKEAYFKHLFKAFRPGGFCVVNHKSMLRLVDPGPLTDASASQYAVELEAVAQHLGHDTVHQGTWGHLFELLSDSWYPSAPTEDVVSTLDTTFKQFNKKTGLSLRYEAIDEHFGMVHR